MKDKAVSKSVYIPTSSSPTQADVWLWYQNAAIELRLGVLHESDIDHFFNPYFGESNLLNWWKLPYFRYHFSRTFAHSATFLLEHPTTGTIVDIGCGCGSQSLYFALKGARVLALDIDRTSLDILARRKCYYEGITRRKLDITIAQADALEYDYTSLGAVSGVHSIFAFNIMQPNSVLINRLMLVFQNNGRLAILDGNSQCWRSRLFAQYRRNVWSPKQFEVELNRRNFQIVKHEGGVVLPPVLWRILPYWSCAAFDGFLSQSWLFPISHHILAELTPQLSSFQR